MTPFTAELARLRIAQQAWQATPTRQRLRCVRTFRRALVEAEQDLTTAMTADVGRGVDESIATDLLPTAAAAKYLERVADRLLKPRHPRGRPFWLAGCRDTVHRRPRGVVGVIGTWNYPVFLNAVPVLHAVTAGNAVLWKPSERTPRTAAVLTRLFAEACPQDLIVTVDGRRENGPALAEADVDFVHFTGSEAVGRTLARRLGERLIPSTLELSGCDAVVVLADADIELSARLIWYGATLNTGQTCMATRRVFVHSAVFESLVERLRSFATTTETIHVPEPAAAAFRRLIELAHAAGCDVVPSCEGRTATLIIDRANRTDLPSNRETVFAPLLTVSSFQELDQIPDLIRQSPLGLTTAVFTRQPDLAVALAERLPVGVVIVNDVIVPTAHPATPFGGRGASGWGVSQGDEGLLEMTQPQVVTVRSGTFRPHADANPQAGNIVRGMLKLTHARRWRDRLAGLRQMVLGMVRSR